MTELEQKLINRIQRLALAIVDAELAWTPSMSEAYEGLYKEAGLTGPPLLTSFFICPFCDRRHGSFSGDGSTIECCGEVGQAKLFYEVTKEGL